MATPRKKAAATEEPEEETPVEPDDEGAIEEGEAEFERERKAAEADDEEEQLEPPRAPEDQEALQVDRRRVIGLTNRNSVELSDGSIVTVRLGFETLLSTDVAAELEAGGLVAYL